MNATAKKPDPLILKCAVTCDEVKAMIVQLKGYKMPDGANAMIGVLRLKMGRAQAKLNYKAFLKHAASLTQLLRPHVRRATVKAMPTFRLILARPIGQPKWDRVLAGIPAVARDQLTAIKEDGRARNFIWAVDVATGDLEDAEHAARMLNKRGADANARTKVSKIQRVS